MLLTLKIWQECVKSAISAHVIKLSYHNQQNTHVFADGRKDMNDIFNNYVCSVSHPIYVQDSIAQDSIPNLTQAIVQTNSVLS